jgi:hypothetical protein
MSESKAQRATKAREFTPTTVAPSEATLQAILDELRAISQELRAMREGRAELEEAIARGVRWAIGGRANGNGQ